MKENLRELLKRIHIYQFLIRKIFCKIQSKNQNCILFEFYYEDEERVDDILMKIITTISIHKLLSKQSGELNIEIDCSLNNERIFEFIIKIEDNVVHEGELELDLWIPDERERNLKNHFDKFIP